jgi:hypothetical protein
MAAVSDLFFRRGPADIAGFVVPVVVDAVDGLSGRALAHVLQESFEAQPTFTNGDAAPAVTRPSIAFRIGASLYYFHPGAIGWRWPSLSGVAMFQTVWLFSSLTAAARLAIKRVHWLFHAAIASSEPAGLSELTDVGKSDDRQSSEALAGDILERRHGGSSCERLCLGATSVSALGRPVFIAQSVS